MLVLVFSALVLIQGIEVDSVVPENEIPPPLSTGAATAKGKEAEMTVPTNSVILV